MMIATLTLNPSLDKTVVLEKLVFEDVNRAKQIYTDPGGKGINVSRVISRFRQETIALGFLGGLTGDYVLALLKEEGVKTDFVPIEGETRTNITIIDETNRKVTKVNEKGPVIREDELDLLWQKIRELEPKPEMAVISGSLPQDVSPTIYRDLIIEFQSKGIKTVFDANGLPLKFGLEAAPYMVKPNIYEMGRLLGFEICDQSKSVAGAKQFLDQGVSLVCLSLAEKGAILATNDFILKAIVPEVEIVSTIGAGDSFVAGFCLVLSKSGDFKEALRFACACGTAAVMTTASKLCEVSQVEKMLPEIQLQELSG